MHITTSQLVETEQHTRWERMIEHTDELTKDNTIYIHTKKRGIEDQNKQSTATSERKQQTGLINSPEPELEKADV